MKLGGSGAKPVKYAYLKNTTLGVAPAYKKSYR
jgi:hypothetical protein